MNRLLLLILIYTFVLTNAYAESNATQTNTDSIPIFRMGEIVVVAERLPMITATSIHEINMPEMRQRDIHQPAEALKFIPGLHVYTAAKNEAVFNLRGFGQRQISVFLDGVPVSLPYDGQIDLSQFNGDHFESIRVSTGATSPLYGMNTLGGSVNLISATGKSRTPLSLRLEGGQDGSYFGSGTYQNTIGPLRFSLYTNYRKADSFRLPSGYKSTAYEDGGKRENSAYENRSAGFKLHYELSARHQIGLNFSHINNAFQIPPNTGTRFTRYWRFPQWDKTVYSLSSRHLFSSRFILRTIFYHDTYYNLLKSYDDATYSTQSMRYAWDSRYDDHSTGFFLYPSLNIWDRGSTNVIMAYKKDVHSEKFRDFPFENYEMASYTIGIEQDMVLTGRHSVILGGDLNYLEPLKAEKADLRDPIMLANGQLAWQYNMDTALDLHASIGKKSRFPTLKELYSERLGRTIPNHDLKAEHAVNTEVGIKKTFSKGAVRANVFYNTLRDLITLRQLGEGTEQLQNTGRAIIRGLELDTEFHLGRVHAQANYSFLDAVNISGNRSNRHLPNRPHHRFNLLIDWNLVHTLGLLMETSHVAGQYYEHPDNLTWNRFDDYMIINARLSYRVLKNVGWYLRADNITDTLYENEFGVPMAGREIRTGVRLEF